MDLSLTSIISEGPGSYMWIGALAPFENTTHVFKVVFTIGTPRPHKDLTPC